MNQMNPNEIAHRLGLRRYPRSGRGRCPSCEYSGTFVIRTGRDGKARLFCANCQDRDAVAEAVARAIGQERGPVHHHDNGDDAAKRARKREGALALWRGSEPASGTPADTYLTTARDLPGLALSPALRYRGDTPHPEGARLPAMIALVAAPDGAELAVHRTYLRRDGTAKADVTPAKASLGAVWGGAIRLDPAAPDLLVGEGVETAGSAGRIFSLPAWAAISCANMASGLVLPSLVRSVLIAADADGPGRRAADEAARRWQHEGRRVRVATPNCSGLDFNDLLRELGNG